MKSVQQLPDDAGVLWISSYPRSGNLWVRNIVRDILIPDAVELVNLDAWFPDIHQGFEKGFHPLRIPAFGDRPLLILKNHFPCTTRLPYFDRTAGAIYIVRHPLDAVVSELKYLLATNPGTVEKGDEHIRWFIEDLVAQVNLFGGSKSNIELDFGTWACNVSSWLSLHHPFPVHLVRYEDLVRRPVETIDGIARFLGVTLDRWKLFFIAKNTRRESMKRMQEIMVTRRFDSPYYRPEIELNLAAGYRYISDDQEIPYVQLLAPHRFSEAMRIFAPILKWLGYDESDIFRR